MLIQEYQGYVCNGGMVTTSAFLIQVCQGYTAACNEGMGYAVDNGACHAAASDRSADVYIHAARYSTYAQTNPYAQTSPSAHMRRSLAIQPALVTE